ncbi:phosphoadenosine phosphosulfate reductase [Klebsiella aerogenes]
MVFMNVYNASLERLKWIFDVSDKVCLSFSGGKDSTVLFHLAALTAREVGKSFYVVFVDWEAQYSRTISHVEKMRDLYSDVISCFYWIALPLTTVNGVSCIQPEWISWAPDEKWVRSPPKDAIQDESFFPFYQHAMTFEEFMPKFSEWLADGEILASLNGVRADESLNRYLAVVSPRKKRFDRNRPWTTASNNTSVFIAYPLYDWKVKDIWLFHALTKSLYNELYDLMYQAGVKPTNMRVCEPFGPEQRKGLWLYHILEPETWGRMCHRVCGAGSGAIYANEPGPYYAYRKKITKPIHFTWREYAFFLLESMPHSTAEHYKNKIAIYLNWYRSNKGLDDIPDEQDKDLGSRDIPSWRRICKVIIKNDYWCRMLSFSPTHPQNYKQYCERIAKKRTEWGIL